MIGLLIPYLIFLSCFQTYPEEDEEKIGSGSNERCYIFNGWYKHFRALKVLRQCPLVLLVKLVLTEGKALEVGLMEAKNLSRGFTAND
jgi:hypothetical protein